MNNLVCWLQRGALAVVVLGLGLMAGPSPAVEVGWRFNDASLDPDFNDHTTTMTYVNGTDTSSVLSYGAATSFGLPAMVDGDPVVMQFPAFQSFQGLALYDLGPANGGGIYVNKYTMAWDILIPDVDANWFAFYNTTAANANDADMYVLPQPADMDFGPDDFGVGISGQYHGTITDNTWFRVVAVVDETMASMKKYINGTFVGEGTLEGLDGRWSLYTDSDNNPPPTADAFLLTDDSGDTNAGYISAYYYTDRLVEAETIAAWGAPKSFGLPGPGDVNYDGSVDIFDVNLVSANWAGTGPTADANHDGTVDIFDVNLISANWTGGGGGGANAVPEPATWLLLALGLAGLALGRRAAKR